MEGAEPQTSMVTEHFGFVDTLQEYPTFWSFESGGLKTLSNQYAAMPSLHTAWAVWCMLVLLPLVRRGWLRGLIVMYPFATFFCIVVTANHYWLDALMGVATLAIGYVIASRVTDWWDARHPSTPAPRGPESSGPDGRDTPSGRPPARDRRAIG